MNAPQSEPTQAQLNRQAFDRAVWEMDDWWQRYQAKKQTQAEQA